MPKAPDSLDESRGSRRVSRCAMELPDDLVGRRVLDLECRGGLGAFKIADRVGPSGWVMGVDSSPENVARAIERAPRYHWAGDGWANYLRFARVGLDGLADGLRTAGLGDASFDVVIVNSALNLAPDLGTTLRDICRALVPDGLLYLDAVFAVEPMPPSLARLSASEGNVFGCAPTPDEFGALLTSAGFSRWDRRGEQSVHPEREDDIPELRGYAFRAAVVRATR